MNAGRLALALIALTLASAAHAEKYVEIWNPPEARGHTGVQKAVRPRALPAAPPRLAKKVTEPAVGHVERGASSVASSKRPSSHSIPRKIGPDGNVFRV